MVEVPAGADQLRVVDAEQVYELSVDLRDDAIQTYTYVTGDGVAEERVEEPYAEWFSTGGTLDETITLHPYLGATWVSPESAVDGTWWVVLKDRRGGLTWVAQRWRTR